MFAHSPHRELLLALAISVLIHAALFGPDLFGALFSKADRPVPATSLQVRLPEPQAGKDKEFDEALLKDTLPESTHRQQPPRTAPGKVVKAGGRKLEAQRKLAEHLFYPEEAIAKGLEGEVRLLLSLAPDGTILDIQLASSSGHALLDRAAVDAAKATRRLPNAGVSELILPVVFELQ